jgi:predicted transcriptional regulator
MKQEILKLRSEGKTYNEIVRLLGCSKGTVSYYCGDGQARKQHERTQGKRGQLMKWLWEYKKSLECCDCKMSFKDRPECCDFHHVDPELKEHKISYKLQCASKESLLKELEKCIPLCANCHRTRHKDRYTRVSAIGSQTDSKSV